MPYSPRHTVPGPGVVLPEPGFGGILEYVTYKKEKSWLTGDPASWP